MLQLSKKTLNKKEADVLKLLQKKINVKKGFATKVAEAQELWKSKGGVAGERAFKVIKDSLIGMCVSVEACNYCEANEASDIEHIYPKTFFPEKTFVWENYLLACKQCNTGYKLDKCYVLDKKGNVYKTIRGNKPKYNTVAIINPRIEDPLKYLWLNLLSWEFNIQDKLSTNDYNKALKTLEILALNERDYLIAGRKRVASECFDKMDRLCRILKAKNKMDIKSIINPYEDIIDFSLPLETIKNNCKASTKAHIHKQQHPSVWESIKTIESKVNSKWMNVFKEIPEALTW
jgi:uncharacterized protein (TIGR02646 family)